MSPSVHRSGDWGGGPSQSCSTSRRIAEPREVRLMLTNEPIPTSVPLASRAAGSHMQCCNCCWGMYPSDRFDFEHGLCLTCSDALVGKGANGDS